MDMKRYNPKYILLILILACTQIFAQEKKPKFDKALFRDTLDNKFDFSRVLIDAHGFLPVVFIITEPALGGFGGALAPLFLSPKKNLPPGSGYVAPDITAGFAMYTANGTWGVGGLRIGSIPKHGLKYRIGGLYADVNVDFYRTLIDGSEKEFAVNIEALPVFFSLSKKITKKGLYAGVDYSFAKIKLKPGDETELPDFVSHLELESTVSTAGVFLDWDSRNTVFTADRGIRANLAFKVNDNWTGSDYDYQKLDLIFNWFAQVKRNWISGLRFESNNVFNDPPFYLLPFVNLRGVPAGRFQGETVYVVETEQRFDLNTRWSVVGFAGYGRTNYRDSKLFEGDNVYNVGGGFRYLIARQFGMRTGIDIAKGTDSWGWYIVLGHNWNR
jgi:hypothetical protein